MKVVTGMHYIRKHILRTLSLTKWARFRDMRPPRVDSNLYSYHLKELIKEGYIEHDEQRGYRLSPYGLRFVNQISMEVFEPRWQPKILTVLVVRDGNRVLLWKKFKQPYIGTWTLPGGKVHYDDESIHGAAVRDILFYSARVPNNLRQIGIYGYRTFINGELINYSLAHIFVGTLRTNDLIMDRPEWIVLSDVQEGDCSPGTLRMIELVESQKQFFFLEENIDW